MGEIDSDIRPVDRKLRPPEPLSDKHDLSDFDCGNADLNIWLAKKARPNEAAGGSRTYVVCSSDKVLGYYCLATGSVARQEATGKAKRNMPDPVPAMVLGRLAVDLTLQGQGIGTDLLSDAVKRTLGAAKIGGIRVLLVHAKDEAAARWYGDRGFLRSPIPLPTLTLMITLQDAAAALEA